MTESSNVHAVMNYIHLVIFRFIYLFFTYSYTGYVKASVVVENSPLWIHFLHALCRSSFIYIYLLIKSLCVATLGM